MLRDYLSADTFKRGIVQYLQKYSYKTTKNEDLWNSMASVSSECQSPPFCCCFPLLWYSFTKNRGVFHRSEGVTLFLVPDLPHRWYPNNGWLLLQKQTLIINLSKSLHLYSPTHAHSSPQSLSGTSVPNFLRSSVKSLSFNSN